MTRQHYTNYAEYWVDFLRKHSRPGTRVCHYLATAIALGPGLYGLFAHLFGLAAVAFGVTYLLAVTSHRFIERDRPMAGKPGWGAYSELTAPPAPGDRMALPVAGRDPVVLTTGDIDRDQIYLGLPDTHEVPGVYQPLVVLNAPPVHFDVFEGGAGGSEIYDVADCFPVVEGCDHYATYSQSQGTTTLVSGTVSSAWAVGTDLTATAGYEGGIFGASVEASLTAEYGQNFEHTQSVVSNFDVQIDEEVMAVGGFYATRADYTVIEYPIYLVSDSPAHGSQNATPISHVATVQRQNVGQTFFPMNDLPDGFLLPSDHAPGNALSYGPRSQNGTVRTEVPILANGGNLGFVLSETGTHQLTISFDSLTSSEQSQGSHLSLGSSVEVEAHGAFAGYYGSVSAAVSGSYASETLQTHSSTIQESTELFVQLGTIDGSLLVGGQPMGSASYEVRPYVYWSHQGALVLDYEVVAGGDGQWWDVVYCGHPFYCSVPDLSFNLPLLHDWEKGKATAADDLERTRDIGIDPPAAMSGQLATLQAVVRNHSLASYTGGALLSFYLEDPRSAEGTWIADVSVPPLASREQIVVSFEGWEVPYGVLPVGSNDRPRIYAVLDEDGLYPELHETNNLGWAAVDIQSPPACNDGVDNDGDGLIDFGGGDPGCAGSIDESERAVGLVCDDGTDNDGDGLVDFPADPGCRDGLSATESPECNDGVDNDGDGFIDAADPTCAHPWKDRERNRACGLGIEGALLARLLIRRRKRMG